MLSQTISCRRLVGLLAVVAAGVAFGLAGCSDSSGPGTPASDLGGALLSADLTPGQGTFVLKSLDESVPDHAPIHVELIGSNLQVDPATEVVSVDVAIRNGGQQPLYAPAMIWLFGLRPDGVTVLNADVTPGPPDTNAADVPMARPRYGFDYTQLLGGDSVLSPEEISDVKTWRFHVPGLTGFSFGVRAEFGMVPNLPRIAGLCFQDPNRNGVPDDGEWPVKAAIAVTGPDSFVVTAFTDAEGRYAVPVTEAGLYTLRCWPLVRCGTDDALRDGGDQPGSRCLTDFTTPNPLQVLLTAGADGRPLSFLQANFGLTFGASTDTLPKVIFTLTPLDSLPTDHYAYQDGKVTGVVMHLRVGFSGCSSDHPFALYWQPGPQMSPLPHANLVLVHDDRGELCDAFWTRDLAFDLRPILARMGGGVMPIYLHFKDAQGVVHDFVLGHEDPVVH